MIQKQRLFLPKLFFRKSSQKQIRKKDKKKMDICHVTKGGEIDLFLPAPAIPAHLAQGGYLGKCDGRTLGNDDDDDDDDDELLIDCETNTCGSFHYTYGASDDMEGAEGQYYEVSIRMEHRKNITESESDKGNDDARYEVGSGIDITNTHFDDPDGLPSGVNLSMGEPKNAVILE
jgi:hypothetical protein